MYICIYNIYIYIYMKMDDLVEALARGARLRDLLAPREVDEVKLPHLGGSI